MPEGLEFVVRAVLIGAGATALLDLWSLFATRAFGVAAPNWGLVGRWIGHFPQGRFMHDNIAKATPIHGERVIGGAPTTRSASSTRLCSWRYGGSTGRAIRRWPRL